MRALLHAIFTKEGESPPILKGSMLPQHLMVNGPRLRERQLDPSDPGILAFSEPLALIYGERKKITKIHARG